MAAVAPSADQTTDLLQKLSLESKNTTHDAAEVAKKPSGIQYGSTNGAEAPKTQYPASERSVTPVLPEYMDHNIWYLHNGYPSSAYYYGGYDVPMGEWDDYSRYLNPEGMDLSHGVYGDMYHHGYGYTPYCAYPSSGSAVPSSHDNHMYGSQQYQYPSPYFQPQASPNGTYPSNNLPTQIEMTSPAVADQPPITVDASKSISNGVSNGGVSVNGGSLSVKQNQQNSSLTSNGSYGRGALLGGHPSPGYKDPKFNFDGMRSPIPWFDGTMFSEAYARSAATNAVPSTASHNTNAAQPRNQNIRSVPQLMGLHSPRPAPALGPAAHGIINRMYPTNRMYGQCGNAYRSGNTFGTNIYDSRINGRWGMFVDGKYRPRGRGNGFYGFSNDNGDGLSELNRGPRANRFKNFKTPVPTPTVTIAAKGQTLPPYENVEDPSIVPGREQYNRADFSDKYSDAKFFVIKSYSEDDIHKSIKYNVWASTPNGNKKLDAAYKDSQDTAVECPVFLFFSVNTSGQFVGVAEMVGPVDFNKTVDYWQQDKWTGCFSVKWHIVKDVPNSILKHITVESNDNKPVTNSRDTQEVKLEQGLQMLKIFKEHISKTSILEDFGFYETRQKVMQEKRAKQLQHSKLIVDLKPVEMGDEKCTDGVCANPRLQKPLEPIKVLTKEAISVLLGERKPSEDSSSPAFSGNAPEGARPTLPEKHAGSNGAANGF